MKLPSKELLSAVLGVKVYLITTPVEGRLTYHLSEDSSDTIPINCISISISELARICRIFVVNSGYSLSIRAKTVEVYGRIFKLNTFINDNKGDAFIPYDPIIDIKACEWIYNEIKGK